jgi:DNA polymerase
MDRDQLKFALVQVLENYRRCGLSRIEREPSGELAAAVIERLKAPLPVPSPHTTTRGTDPTAAMQPTRSVPGGTQAMASAISSPSAVPAVAAVVSAVGPHADSAASLATDSSSGTRLSVGGSTWELPILGIDDRVSQFAELRQQVASCRQCVDIVSYRQQTVFGSGPLNPTVCFMGEAPGADEDRTGEPFVGKAGQLLSKIIAAMKLKREEVYILNALKCRPPQNRTPVPDEITHCRHFVATQLNVLQPKYIVCLGSVAVQSLLQSTLPIGRLRGRFHEYRGAQVVVTYHPSYLLRNESAKRLVWDDMQMLMREMGLLPR